MEKTPSQMDERAAQICGQLVEEGFDGVMIILSDDVYQTAKTHANSQDLALAGANLLDQAVHTE